MKLFKAANIILRKLFVLANHRKTTMFEKYLATYFKPDLYPTTKDVPDFLSETKTADFRWKFYIRFQIMLLLCTGVFYFTYERNARYSQLETANARLNQVVAIQSDLETK
ncbi:uncharacterized protein LOC142356262 [Convolutriloba macropyga]|uniref:uncharacterized protein LOC142356262 n=1 Tax=Convolutriloba macropyga TaxID=536237 RepID=UPI003F52268A